MAFTMPSWGWIIIGLFTAIGAIVFLIQFKERIIRYLMTFICAGASGLMATGILETALAKFLSAGWYPWVSGFIQAFFVSIVTTVLIVVFKLYRTQVVVG